MSRQLKTHVARSVDPSVQGITASALPASTVQDDPTQREDDLYQEQETRQWTSEPTVTGTEHGTQRLASKDSASMSPSARHRTKQAPRSIERTLMISQTVPCDSKPGDSSSGAVAKGTWTQLEQKQLESALNRVPKGSTDRWDRISELVPSKTKVHF